MNDIIFSVRRRTSLKTLFYKAKIKYRLTKTNYDKIEITTSVIEAIGSFSGYNEKHCTDKNLLIKEAQDITNGHLHMLGNKSSFHPKIDWHSDFISGFVWKKGKYFRRYLQDDLTNNADVKVPREISRCHHLLILGQAYLVTKEELYAEAFVNQVTDWIDENPFLHSINWGCTMDISIRAINWVYTFNMFSGSPRITDEFKYKFRRSLYEHGWIIYRNPEKNMFNNGNHYDAGLAGQLLLGLVFSKSPEGNKWFAKAKFELFKEIRTQILPSGVVYEKTTNYIRLVNEIFLFAYILLDKSGAHIPLDIKYRIEKQFDFLLDSTINHGKQPTIGDQDDAKLLPFSTRQAMDSRFLLSIGSIIFNRSDLKNASPGFIPDCFFLLGTDAFDKYHSISSTEAASNQSKAYEDAGFYIMRHNELYMFIANSGIAKYSDLSKSYGSHTHCDLLSFVLAIGEKVIMTDPGTFVYTSDAKQRNYFRSTQKHNTVVVDGQDQHVINDQNLFSYHKIAEPVFNTWNSDASHDVFTGAHNGYMRLKDPVMHTRKIAFYKEKREWSIHDHLTGTGKHRFEWFFHFSPGVMLEKTNNSISASMESRKLQIDLIDFPDTEILLFDDYVSTAYGRKTSSKSMKFITNAACPLHTIINISVK